MYLARALFEKEEALLPEGETWASLAPGDRSHYEKCAMAVVDALIVSESMDLH